MISFKIRKLLKQNMEKVIKLNVGGQLKEITQCTLEKSPLFETIFHDYPELIGGGGGDAIPFIDRDPTKFDDVVLYLGWGVLSENIECMYELDHYGILLLSDDDGLYETKLLSIEEKVDILAEQIVNNSNPYVISACGRQYVTTKERLMQIDYFNGMFKGGFNQKYKGTIEDPYRIDIPPLIFANILEHLRDNRIELSPVSVNILEKLGEFKKTEVDQVITEYPKISPTLYHGGAMLQLTAPNYLHRNTTNNNLYSLWKSEQCKQVQNSVVGRASYPFIGNCVRLERINYNPDLIYKCYLRWTFAVNGESFNVASLIKKDKMLLYKLVDHIDLEIGGQTIEHLEGYQLYMLSLMDIIERTKMLDVTDLTINIPFYFCLNPNKALPLVALHYHIVEIKITPRKIIGIEHVTATPELLISYTYLDTSERRYFSDNRHTYLLPLYYPSKLYQTTASVSASASASASTFYIPLRNYYYNTRAIFFTLHVDDSTDSLYNPQDDLISYKLDINNKTRTECDRLLAKLDKIDNKIAIDNNVYVIPFALEPLNGTQPTMGIQMNHGLDVALTVVASCRVKYICVWGNYWNILMIHKGIAGLAFAT
jgi:Major capsid protein N-terminus